jgi:hypothetical protein
MLILIEELVNVLQFRLPQSANPASSERLTEDDDQGPDNDPPAASYRMAA